ncbi:MAG: phosphate/phosphite/phosphonate ABC transporter substrate-binding protein [Candidatus Edwardsbacteria bacterium]|nr:phosphate/phosphite/phosphonate ABC transporter substrate-binding protein [Candidatus Edwardsbacteria bacterium]
MMKSNIKNKKTKTRTPGHIRQFRVVFYFLSLVFSITSCGNLPQGRYGQEAVKIAVLPAYSTAAMSARYLPLLNKLSRETGFDVQYISAENIPGFGAAIENSQAQLAICDALTFLTLQKTKNAVALAIGRDQNGSTETGGLIITSFAAYARGIDDASKLKGRAVCCASRQSAEGYLSQAKYLFDQGIDPERDLRVVAVGQLDRVLAGLGKGDFAAGFIPQSQWNDSLAKCYRILATGQPVPNWVLASLQGGHTEMDDKVKDAILALDPAKPEDQEILAGLGIFRFTDAGSVDLRAFSAVADQMKIPY